MFGAGIALKLLTNPLVIVSILLALSLGGNFAQRKLHQHDLTVIGQRTAEREAAILAGKACSEATERLQAESEARAKAVSAAAALAHARAVQDERRATATLQEKPATPTDLCGSALELSRRKIIERRKPE